MTAVVAVSESVLAAIKAGIDETIERNKPREVLRFADSDWDDAEFDYLVLCLKEYVKEKGYLKTYSFHVDGIAMSCENLIKIRQKELPRIASCWGEPDWTE